MGEFIFRAENSASVHISVLKYEPTLIIQRQDAQPEAHAPLPAIGRN
jgi:hypothetical protein